MYGLSCLTYCHDIDDNCPIRMLVILMLVILSLSWHDSMATITWLSSLYQKVIAWLYLWRKTRNSIRPFFGLVPRKANTMGGNLPKAAEMLEILTNTIQNIEGIMGNGDCPYIFLPYSTYLLSRNNTEVEYTCCIAELPSWLCLTKSVSDTKPLKAFIFQTLFIDKFVCDVWYGNCIVPVLVTWFCGVRCSVVE